VAKLGYKTGKRGLPERKEGKMSGESKE